MPGIKVVNLNKAFSSFKAVDNVSFEIKKGELVSLLGPSGSGKSTILRIIAGLEEQDSGKIILSGEDVSGFKTQKRNIGFVFQHYALFRHMTVEQNIAFGLEVRKVSKELIRDKIAEMVNLVKLNGYEKHYPNQLSGGQRQRVALARALAPDPSILLLDEPFGALDSKVRKNLAAWIREMHNRVNLTSIFVTHDQSEAMEISSKIIVINKGRKEQAGTPREIYESPASPFVASFVGRINVIEGILSEKGLISENTDKPIPLPFISEKFINKRVILFIRPEDISAHEKSTETFSAEHIDSVYKGDSYSISFKTGDFTLNADIPKKEFRLLSENSINLRINEYRVFENCKDKGTVKDMILQKGYID